MQVVTIRGVLVYSVWAGVQKPLEGRTADDEFLGGLPPGDAFETNASRHRVESLLEVLPLSHPGPVNAGVLGTRPFHARHYRFSMGALRFFVPVPFPFPTPGGLRLGFRLAILRNLVRRTGIHW